MAVLHTLTIGLAAVCIVGIIAWGCNSCSQQETAIREACIRAGGSVVVTGGPTTSESHCIRSGAGGER